ncbi:hypothetical protein [Streptomyces sp. MMBL 11-3]|uniref:hypothetical protein n=1 Tax=Streptomyces sp. MMBL 11-3 TaxID=3382639 RepID=UPI0039B5EAEB
MRRARIAAALTGLALTGLATPAMADEEPQAPMSLGQAVSQLNAEQHVLEALAGPFIHPNENERLQEIRQQLGEDRLKALADQQLEQMRRPTADSKFNDWRNERDAKQREAFLAKTDSQFLGLNPFLKP